MKSCAKLHYVVALHIMILLIHLSQTSITRIKIWMIVRPADGCLLSCNILTVRNNMKDNKNITNMYLEYSIRLFRWKNILLCTADYQESIYVRFCYLYINYRKLQKAILKVEVSHTQ